MFRNELTEIMKGTTAENFTVISEKRFEARKVRR